MTLINGLIIVIVTGLLTRWLSRPKTKVDIDEVKIKAQSESLDVILKSQEILQQLLHPLQLEIDQLRQEINEMKPFLCKNTDCTNRKK